MFLNIKQFINCKILLIMMSFISINSFAGELEDFPSLVKEAIFRHLPDKGDRCRLSTTCSKMAKVGVEHERNVIFPTANEIANATISIVEGQEPHEGESMQDVMVRLLRITVTRGAGSQFTFRPTRVVTVKKQLSDFNLTQDDYDASRGERICNVVRRDWDTYELIVRNLIVKHYGRPGNIIEKIKEITTVFNVVLMLEA
jgi:hypothetical protein